MDQEIGAGYNVNRARVKEKTRGLDMALGETVTNRAEVPRRSEKSSTRILSWRGANRRKLREGLLRLDPPTAGCRAEETGIAKREITSTDMGIHRRRGVPNTALGVGWLQHHEPMEQK